MDSIVNLCLLAIFVVVGFMLLTRLLGGMGRGGNYDSQGPEQPEYDDPEIGGGGAFGRRPGGSGLFGGGSERPTHNDPGVRGRGFFGGSRSSGGGGFGSFFRGGSGGSRGSF